MAMLKARRVLLFGDDCQLPPIQVSCPLTTCGERGVLQRLPLSELHTLLDTTYRMHPVLCEWPSRTFYEGKLQAHTSTHEVPPPFSRCPERWWKCVSNSLEQEVQNVTRAVLRLREERPDAPPELAVLTPFRSHARKIRAALRREGVEVRVDTVERMQGQECDVVLFAAGVEDAKRVAMLGDFLFQVNKLNVAVTRARGGVLLFAHPVLLETRLYGEPGNHQSVWRSLFDQAVEWHP
jgi:DNA replication ATP-dependent helicase Dna2